ncbi:ATP-binding protein [Hirschia litorea]|uniref:ATP-binding protein n=1 Tax=Hirschia litorea TaxID=1199156 RepID=A0ABW2INM9_9PROT
MDSLRQPLENGEAVISRANRHVRYPSRFQLIAAANPCKCGGGPSENMCRRKPACKVDYMGRVSGPFLDRIDLFIDVPAVTAMDLTLPPPIEGSAQVAKRVQKARHLQEQRYKEVVNARHLNVDADTTAIDAFCTPEADGQALLMQAAEKLGLSARGYHRVLKVSRTIADLDGASTVRRIHVAEALNYRFRPIGMPQQPKEMLRN